MNASKQLGWTDEFVLGYGPIDHIHEEFVTVVDRLLAAPDAELSDALNAVETHLRAHFDEENAWMRETQFPPRDCHIDEHAAVLKSVHEVQELLAGGGNTQVCRDLARALADWFPGHATHLDSALAHWMCKRKLGGKPVVLRRSAAVAAGDD